MFFYAISTIGNSTSNTILNYLFPFLTETFGKIIYTTLQTTLTGSIYLVQSLFQSGYEIPQFQFELRKMDLENDLLITQSFTDNLEKSFQHLLLDPTLQNSLHGVQMIMKNIYQILWKCTDKINYHKTKWFYTYRTICLDEELKSLLEQQNILKKRFEWLEKTLQLCLQLTPYAPPKQISYIIRNENQIETNLNYPKLEYNKNYENNQKMHDIIYPNIQSLYCPPYNPNYYKEDENENKRISDLIIN